MIRGFFRWLVNVPRIWWAGRIEKARQRYTDDGIEAVRARVQRLNTEVEIIERKARRAF